jgi:uncharacterized membrane protein YpjA
MQPKANGTSARWWQHGRGPGLWCAAAALISAAALGAASSLDTATVVAWNEPLRVPVAAGRFVAFDALWSLLGLRSTSSAWRWAPLALAVASGLVAASAPRAWKERAGRGTLGFARLAAVFGAALGAFWLLRLDPTHATRLGDSGSIAYHLSHLGIFGAEALTAELFAAAPDVARRAHWELPQLDAMAAVVCVSGGFYATALVDWAFTTAKPTSARLMLAALLLSSGATIQFFGYIETTCVALAAGAVYLAAANRALEDHGSAITPAQVLAHGALGIAVCAHSAAVCLLPSAFFLHARRGRGLRSSATWTLLLTLIATPIFLVLYLPYYSKGQIGNIVGGADQIAFLPLHFDPNEHRSECLHYGLFSSLHWVELGNALLLTSLAWPVALAASWGAPLRRAWSPRVLLHGLAAAGGAAVVFFWHFDFSMYGDWNIVTAYLVPLHVSAWGWAIEQTAVRGRRALLAVAAPAVAGQLLIAASWYSHVS